MSSQNTFKTKDGRPIRMVANENIVDPKRPDDLWDCHLIEAFVGDVKAGYLRVACVTPERLEKHMPTVWHYAKKLKGWILDLEEPIELWRRAHLYAQTSPRSLPQARYTDLHGYSPSMKEIMLDLMSLERVAGLDGEFSQWRKYSVGRAFVDFSQTFHPTDKTDNPGAHNFRGVGIGFAMYVYAAQWLSENYWYDLHSSGPSTEAKKTWERLIAAGQPIIKTISSDNDEVPQQTSYRFNFCED